MRAAFYECDITPPLGCFIWGHYERRFAEDVMDRLYAKAAVIESEGELAAILCIDACALPHDMHDAVTRRVQEFTGIDPERVCITVNHTHWGAPILSLPELNSYKDDPYTDVCYRLCADAVILAYKRLQESKARFGKTELYGYSFNRDYVMEDGSVRTFHPGKQAFKEMFADIDPDVSVMSFEQDGKPVGAIFNFALHQCCCDVAGKPNNKYTGDFSSIVAKELKALYGSDFVCIFLQGTAGDINHVDNDRTKPRNLYTEIGSALAKKVNEAMQTATPVGEGITVKKQSIVLQKRLANEKYIKEFAVEHLDNPLFLMRLRNLIYYKASNTETEATLRLQTIKIGNTVLYCMPGEVYADFGLALKERAESENVMVVEFCNDYCGYIPTKRAFAENCDLYETSLCHHSCLEPDAGDKMVEMLLDMQP